ncbi:MAG: cell division topological specificity factor MinE [Lachnospiraceae bacterium]|nr:cell division topological specificity factor MinE [Lachnospiraceae bacterium]
MMHLFKKGKTSRMIARERLSNLLTAERIDCSPRMMQMIKNDIGKTISRYLTVDAQNISIKLERTSSLLIIYVPMKDTEEKHV